MGSNSRGQGLRDWWQRVTDGLTVRELWQEFRREAGASYRLYSRELEDQLEDQPRWRRWWATMRALATAMLMRLSPARRVFLLLALVLMIWPRGEHSSGLADRLAGLMLFGLLVMELADWVTMKRDLELAREIQQWLVPQQVPRIPGVDCAFVTQPANTVAGDYFDVFVRPSRDGDAPAPVASSHGATTSGAEAPPVEGPLVVVVADVAGKSMPAALLMATFQASLRTLMFEPLPLQRVVGRLNRYAFEHSLEGRRFTTAFLAEIDLPSGRLTYVNAGHNAPILRRAGGAIERLETGGLLLGVREPTDYEAGALTLVPGDTLVIFTDGVADARSRRGEQFGEPRLVELLRALPEGPAGLSAEATLQLVLRAVDVHVQDAPQEDDVTCLVLRYQGVGASPTL